MVISRHYLAGFRVQGIYSPAIMRALSSCAEAEQAAASWRDLPVTARAEDGSRSFTAMVTGPPPMELTRQGRTYYLAHFNAHRAICSPHPPPAEPSAADGCDGT